MARRKTRRFSKNERVIFQAGVSEGLSRRQAAAKKLKDEHKQAIAELQKTIANYKKATFALWEEVHRLDTNKPSVGVLISRVVADRISASLIKHNPAGQYAKSSLYGILKRCIENSERRNLGPIAEHLTTIDAERRLEQEE